MTVTFEELKKDSNGLLRGVFDQSQDCIKVISAEGTLEYMNANGQMIMEIDDFAMVAGRRWADLWPEDSRAMLVEAVANAVAGRETRFEAFCPTMAGSPRWWDVSVSPIRDEQGAVIRVLSTSRDISKQYAERTAEHQARLAAEQSVENYDVITKEMRHRLKNLLSIVGAIARLTGRKSERTESFLPLFTRRLDDLSAAQHLLTEHADSRADLKGLIEMVLGDDLLDDRITISDQPDVRLDEQSTRVVALILGELLTNAAKYGALATDGGRIDLTIEQAPDRVRLAWSEELDKPLTPPTSRGSGTTLMERVSSGQPEPFTADWGERGLTANFAVAC